MFSHAASENSQLTIKAIPIWPFWNILDIEEQKNSKAMDNIV